ncbi:MAG: hypothetical protein OEV59_00600 [Deltaproteobacteria bacterium]|nr:hypothetical protein [Deltaproteobacteria bacterium]
MRGVDKKHIAVIVALWALAVIFYVALGKGSSSVALTGVTRGQSVKVMLGTLDTRPKPSASVKRDIFRPVGLAKAVVAPPPPVVVAIPAPVPPPEPLVAVFAKDARFMGYVNKSEKKTIFIARGADVYIVKVGDVIENYYKVAEISGDSVKIVDERSSEEAYIKASAAGN